MQKLVDLLHKILPLTRFDVGIGELLRAEMIRAMYVRYTRDPHYVLNRTYVALRSARVIIPDSFCPPLVEFLGQFLSDYIDLKTKTIGVGSTESTIADFSVGLVRTAATLGPERTVEVLVSWIEGKPYQCQLNASLSGVGFDHALALEEGIRISEIPISPDRWQPYSSYAAMGVTRKHSIYVGALLSIDATSRPVFYMPLREKGQGERSIYTWAQGLFQELPIETFCEALSLASNRCVRWRYQWGDAGELMEFSPGLCPGFARNIFSERESQKALTQEQLERARDIHVKRNTSASIHRGLNIAVLWWLNTKRPEASWVDTLVGLRIALEALYLRGNSGEIQFRLATYASWHLGGDFDERNHYHKMFRDFYKLASKVVHGRSVEAAASDYELCNSVQDACRKGILRLIEDSERVDWDELILGG